MFCQAFPAIEYVFGLLEIMNEMELGRNRYRTRDCLRTPKEFMKIWRELQILNVNCMYNYATIVVPANQWLFSIWCVYCIYGFIKLDGPFAFITFVAAVLILTYLIVMFSVLAQVQLRSTQVLNSWGSQRQSLLFKKFLRSTRSIKIYIGSFYFVDHGMVLNMLKFISESTVNLIVVN
ncbi:unnamed protein product [Allacma fusca]|uniref:Uncharacterized protein n=1 Tax=Allacma fusca TaxID=39272 RepID=A0A8J2KE53_9HEXA|nr:unnamed protein product [Allacma fusca]